MGIVGLVGGLGPESTIDYYRRLIDGWRAIDPGTSPAIVVDSLDAQRALRLVSSDRDALVEYLSNSVERLERAGADFIAITANTPHIVFDDLVARSSVALLSIVEVCAREAVRRGFTRVALLGTRFTMEASFYPEVLARHGVTMIAPTADDRAWIHDRYVNQLLRGDFRDGTRAEFVALIERLRRDERADGVILGGTELPLLLGTSTVAGVPVLDTTELHVRAILERLRALELTVELASLSGEDASTLITALNTELSSAYAEPGANHFRLDPAEVAPGAGAFVVARWRGEAVGCGALRCLHDDASVAELGPNVGELKRMFVAPSMRGRGIGRAILERLQHDARELGVSRLVLETGIRQLDAIQLYRAAGFDDIPPYGEYVASAATSVCMSKHL
jgi:aspartate racemase